jgi:hypothetical protein
VEVERTGEDAAEAALRLPGETTTETRVAVSRTREGWRIDRLGVRDEDG